MTQIKFNILLNAPTLPPRENELIARENSGNQGFTGQFVRGWAEPHYLRSFGLMPPGALLAYTPKNPEELAVCYSLFAEAYYFACKFGKRAVIFVLPSGHLLDASASVLTGR